VRENILVEDPTCHACPVACKKEVEIKEGPYAGLRMESFEYEPAWALGANCDNADAASIAKIIDLSNDYGWTRSRSATCYPCTWRQARRLYERRRWLKWGDQPAMVETVHKIAFREGIGDVLAEAQNLPPSISGIPKSL